MLRMKDFSYLYHNIFTIPWLKNVLNFDYLKCSEGFQQKYQNFQMPDFFLQRREENMLFADLWDGQKNRTDHNTHLINNKQNGKSNVAKTKMNPQAGLQWQPQPDKFWWWKAGESSCGGARRKWNWGVLVCGGERRGQGNWHRTTEGHSERKSEIHN